MEKPAKRRSRADRPDDHRLANVTEVLVELYRSRLFSLHHRRPVRPVIDPASQKFFRAAAKQVLSAGVDPREYVVAQFEKWEELSQRIGRHLIPMPHHLHGLGALVRYLEWSRQKQERKDREATDDKRQVPEFYCEQRKLNGMSRLYKKPPSDILLEHPKEFSEAFLRSKRVWRFVKDAYDASKP